MALLDIDFFKKYNDRYGHQEGDAALKAVAQAVRRSLRRGSDRVFRVGGEEFAMLLMLRHPDELEPLMRQVNQAVWDLQIPHEANPPGVVTVSIGAVWLDRDRVQTVDEAYRRADECLYQAKSSGRNQTVAASA